MSFKKETAHAIRGLIRLPVLRQLNSKTVSRVRFKQLTLQRELVLSAGFRSFMDLTLAKVRDDRLWKLERVILDNIADECGLDAQGNYNVELEHVNWHADYLTALGLEPQDEAAHLTDKAYENESSFCLLGRLLAIENMIPIEFRALKTSRDHVFPEKFVISEADSDETKFNKRKAAQYIDDHIIHDAKVHFPKLLEGLDYYLDRSKLAHEVIQGIDLAYQKRRQFYQ